MNAPIIKGVGLYRAFGGINAIAGVDVEIGARDLLCVIGPNGAGKSTLVGLMSGAIVPGAGELYLAGARMERIEVLGRSACAERSSVDRAHQAVQQAFSQAHRRDQVVAHRA
nr:ATP-binding cassette domain-containing protein [Burkholderia cenocepacia]